MQINTTSAPCSHILVPSQAAIYTQLIAYKSMQKTRHAIKIRIAEAIIHNI